MKIHTIAFTFILFLFTGCATFPSPTPEGNYVNPIGSSSVTSNPTPYTPALACMKEKIRSEVTDWDSIRISVGRIDDYTGTYSIREGNRITKGGSLMVMSTIAKLGIHQVERFDAGIAKEEMRYIDQKRLGHPKEATFVPYYTGRIRASDYFIAGGITELNFNIRTNMGEVKIPELGFGARYAVMNVALDLRLVHTSSLEIVHVVSMQKQLIGRELKAGVFDFIGSTFTVGLMQEKQAEPMQLGVRTVIERAAMDLMSPLFGIDPEACITIAEEALEEKRKAEYHDPKAEEEQEDEDW